MKMANRICDASQHKHPMIHCAYGVKRLRVSYVDKFTTGRAGAVEAGMGSAS
jgi:hypothetical protein